MKLIINTPSSMKITRKKQLTETRKEPWVFTFIYIEKDDRANIVQTWESRQICNPTEDDLAIQAQKFLSETGDWHAYLEGIKINKETGTIVVGMGS